MRALCHFRARDTLLQTEPRSGPVIAVSLCAPGPLLRQSDPKLPFVELDHKQIRPGSKLHLEVEVYPTGIGIMQTDKIKVTKL